MVRNRGDRHARWRLPLSAVAAVYLQGCAALHQGNGAQPEKLVTQGFSPVHTGTQVRAWVAERIGFGRHQRLANDTEAQVGILNVYIEGDGAAWIGGQFPPQNPTPRNAVAMDMALLDRGARVAYVGRPCQFFEITAGDGCDPSLWADGRFGEAAMAMTDQALDALLAGFPAGQRLNLIGFSGGGTLALLVAAGRTDIECVVTVASPLDIDAWADLKQVRRLSASLNPATANPVLSRIRQTHIFSGADTVVPRASVGRYANWRRPNDVRLLSDGPRHDNWAGVWPGLMAGTCLHESLSRYTGFPRLKTGARPDSPNWRA